MVHRREEISHQGAVPGMRPSTSRLTSGATASNLDCKFFNLTFTVASVLVPSSRPFAYDALQLQNCNIPSPQRGSVPHARHETAPAIYVTHAGGRADGMAHRSDLAFESVHEALEWRRAHGSNRDIVLTAGVHVLNKTIELGPRDSGVTLRGEPGAVVSGGVPLTNLSWSRAADGRGGKDTTWVATVPVRKMDALYTLSPHRRLTRARYPNGDLETVQWGYSSATQYDVAIPAAAVSHWQVPPAGAKPTSNYVDLTQRSNPTGAVKDDSTMEKYNAYGTGRGGLCDELWDTSVGGSGSCTLRGSNPAQRHVASVHLVWRVVTDWCGNNTAGGWAEVDAGMAAEGVRLLPTGMEYVTSSNLSSCVANHRGDVVTGTTPRTRGSRVASPSGATRRARWCARGTRRAGSSTCSTSRRTTRRPTRSPLTLVAGRAAASGAAATSATTCARRSARARRSSPPARGSSRTFARSSTRRANGTSTRRRSSSSCGPMARRPVM